VFESKLISHSHAAEIAERFLKEFGTVGVENDTNGKVHGHVQQGLKPVSRTSQNATRSATLDAGVRIVGPHRSGRFWVWDED